MTDFNQFGSVSPGPGFSPDCQRCERDVTDFIDGLLAPEDQIAFDAHLASCAECQQMLADTQRGVAWLEMLKVHRPEPPADLVDRILRATSNSPQATTIHNPLVAPILQDPLPAGQLPAPIPFVVPKRARPSIGALLQTRLAMTAAMAFFSVALTLNLTGLHLTNLRARDLRPSSLRRDVSDLNAYVFRYYESLRVVYELESRVRDLQHGDDQPLLPAVSPSAAPQPTDTPTHPEQNPDPADKPASGNSHGRSSDDAHPRETPLGSLPHSAPDNAFSPLPTAPTPGLATPVALHIARLPKLKGQRV